MYPVKLSLSFTINPYTLKSQRENFWEEFSNDINNKIFIKMAFSQAHYIFSKDFFWKLLIPYCSQHKLANQNYHIQQKTWQRGCYDEDERLQFDAKLLQSQLHGHFFSMNFFGKLLIS